MCIKGECVNPFGRVRHTRKKKQQQLKGTTVSSGRVGGQVAK